MLTADSSANASTAIDGDRGVPMQECWRRSTRLFKGVSSHSLGAANYSVDNQMKHKWTFHHIVMGEGLQRHGDDPDLYRRFRLSLPWIPGGTALVMADLTTGSDRRLNPTPQEVPAVGIARLCAK
jgi:hypothetical protein